MNTLGAHWLSLHILPRGKRFRVQCAEAISGLFSVLALDYSRILFLALNKYQTYIYLTMIAFSGLNS